VTRAAHYNKFFFKIQDQGVPLRCGKVMPQPSGLDDVGNARALSSNSAIHTQALAYCSSLLRRLHAVTADT